MRPLEWGRRSLKSAHGKVVHSRRVVVLANHFAELIPQGHSVLDVGCGDGLIDSLILERRPDLTISGVDLLVRPGCRIGVVPFDGYAFPTTISRAIRYCFVTFYITRRSRCGFCGKLPGWRARG